MAGYSSALKRALVAAGLILGPAGANAAIVDLFSYGTAGTPPNGHEWTLDVTVDGGQAIFEFSKTQGGGGYGLTDIYFEEGLGTLLTGTPTLTLITSGNSAALAFSPVSTNDPDEPNLVPGSGNPWGDGLGTENNLVHYRYTGDFDNSLDRATGNNLTELLKISWTYSADTDGTALLAALQDGSGSSRLAVRVGQQQGGGTCPNDSCGLSTVNPIPLPPAVWLLGSSLVAMVVVSARKSKPST